MNGFLPRQKARRSTGLILSELLFVIVIVVMLSAVASSTIHRVREKTHITIDLANLRQILKASAIYNSDNNGYMAHPTWGSDFTGPDGWAYITRNNGRLPGYPSTPPSCVNRDVNTVQFTNQLAFSRKGQVTEYLDGVKTTWCPKDVAMRQKGSGPSSLRGKWLARSVKVTSYAWNGTIGGYIGPKAANLNGRTYKVSQFRPTDWQMWETDDREPFNFNDAADNPENVSEFLSWRHSGLRNWWSTISTPRQLGGGALAGSFDGSAKFVQWPRVSDLRLRRVPPPNEILNGPGYQP